MIKQLLCNADNIIRRVPGDDMSVLHNGNMQNHRFTITYFRIVYQLKVDYNDITIRGGLSQQAALTWRIIMELKIIPAYDFPNEIRILFSEYTKMLIAGDSSFQKYLELQNYDDELEHLDIKYGFPDGRLYIAFYNGELAGCIGLRKIDQWNCEMKRLYVRPAFRGKHIGSKLVQQIIKDAKEIGYSHMLLDTLPFLKIAIDMYKAYGFYEISSYNDSPMSTSIYMKLDL